MMIPRSTHSEISVTGTSATPGLDFNVRKRRAPFQLETRTITMRLSQRKCQRTPVHDELDHQRTPFVNNSKNSRLEFR